MLVSSNHIIIRVDRIRWWLHKFATSFAKPLMPNRDTPILALMLHQLINQGLEEVTLTLGHLSKLTRDCISQRRIISALKKINFLHQDSPTGGAASLARIAGLSSTFVAMSGDTLTKLDLADLIRAHKMSCALLTIAASAKQVKINLGR